MLTNFGQSVLMQVTEMDPNKAIGTTIVELTDVSQNIVINSALKEAYKGNVLMNDHMSGDFPALKPGLNGISWTGTVTQVVVTPNWRAL